MQDPTKSFLLIGTDEEVAVIQAELLGQGLAPRMQSILPDAVSESLPNMDDVAAVCCVPNAMKMADLSALYCFCQERGIVLFFCSPGLAVLQKNMGLKNVGFLSLFSPLEEPLSCWWNRLMKRLFDLLVSGVFLFFIFPFIYIVVALLIKRKSAGPVFLFTKKTGRKGKCFEQITFRTEDFPADSLLQKSAIKSLPQFMNVFGGSMSVVGVRDLDTSEEASFSVNYVKPGMVKCHLCKNADIWYIQNWSMWLDFSILLKTLFNKNKIE